MAQAGRRMNQGHELQNTPTQPVSTQEPQLPHTGDPFTGCYRHYDRQPDAIRQCPADTVHRACAHAPFFPEKARNTWIVLALFCPPSTAGFYAFPLLRSWQSGKILRLSQEDKSLSFWAQTFLCVLAKQEGEGDGNYSLGCKNKNVTKKKKKKQVWVKGLPYTCEDLNLDLQSSPQQGMGALPVPCREMLRSRKRSSQASQPGMKSEEHQAILFQTRWNVSAEAQGCPSGSKPHYAAPAYPHTHITARTYKHTTAHTHVRARTHTHQK